MPTFITTLYAFIAANLPFFVQIAVLLASIGAFFGWLAGRFAGSKAANVFAIIAAYTIDVMKIVDEVISLFGGQPPMLGRRRTTKGPFDDVITPATPVIDLGKKPSPDSTKKINVPEFRLGVLAPFGFAIVVTFLISLVMMVACANLPATITATANEVACVTAQIDQNASPTFESLVSACGLDSLTLAEQIVADILTAEKGPADAATTFVVPSEFHKHALAVHHADGGVQ